MIDSLVAQYGNQIAKSNVRCMIKTVVDPLWLEQRRAFAFSEPAAYAGGSEALNEKLKMDQAGVEVSVIDDCCLVRTGQLEQGRDRDRCVTCKEGPNSPLHTQPC